VSTDNDNDDGTTPLAYNSVQLGIMVSALCAGGLSSGDQGQLAVLLGWTGLGGLQAAFLPGSVITLEAVTLVVWNKAKDPAMKKKTFGFSILAALVSLSLNIIWGRIHNGYGEVTEALVWYASAVPNIMLVASLKVGSFLSPPRKRKRAEELPAAELPPEPEEEPLPAPELPEEEPLPTEPPNLPPNEEEKPNAGKKREDGEEEDPDPGLFPVPGEASRTVLICLAEIADRKTLNPDHSLEDLTGKALAAKYHKPTTRRAWNMAKSTALRMWEKDPDRCLDLLGQSRQLA
jgi:hypothetical protein